MIHLLDQGSRIDDDTVPDHAERTAVKDTGGNEVKDKGSAVVDHGVPGVRAALIADDRIGVTCQDVDDLPLAFVAPLGADHNQITHRIETPKKQPWLDSWP